MTKKRLGMVMTGRPACTAGRATGEQKGTRSLELSDFLFNVFKRKEDWLHFRDEIWLKGREAC